MSNEFLKKDEHLAQIISEAFQFFDFEDRKTIQDVILSVALQSDETKVNFTLALQSHGIDVVSSLLDKYTQLGSATLVGIYLRVFTSSEELLESCWLDLGNISKLKKRCLSPDFNVQSDALETMRVSSV